MRIFLLLLAIASLSSCTKTEDGDFKLAYTRPFRIEAGSGTLLTYVVDMDILTGWTAFLKSNNLTAADIGRISVRSVTISPLLANEISYRFIEEARVFIQDPTKPQSKIPIGSAYPQPNERVSNLFMFPGIADLNDYLPLPQIKVYVELRYRDIITSTTDHQVEMQFNIFKK
jgi:hypothetical protein